MVQTRKVHGSRRMVSAIKLADRYMQFNEDMKLVHIWSGDDGKAYEARTIRGTKVFVPFKMIA